MLTWHAGASMAWWMLSGGLLWVAFWVTIVYLAVSLVRGRDRR